jgi:hypothetical protein
MWRSYARRAYLMVIFSLSVVTPCNPYPSFSASTSSAIFRSQSDNPTRVASWSLRKSAMVWKFGVEIRRLARRQHA